MIRQLPHADLLAQAGKLLGERLVDPTGLAGSRRSIVIRARVEGTSRTVVVKRFLTTDGLTTGFAREAAGLRLLPSTAQLLAADKATRTIVMTDVGAHPTLADHLRGQDPEIAWAASVTWAAALGRLCAAGAGRTESFDAEHRRWGGGDEDQWLEAVPGRGVRRLVDELGLPSPAGLDDDLRRVAALANPGTAGVLTPGDTCPDNVLLAGPSPNDVTFVDLEATSVHHVALDAAYVVLPFASCWCVFTPAPGLTGAMVSAFTTAAAPGIGTVAAPAFWTVDVPVASGAWVLAASSWLLDGALEDNPRIGPREGAAPSYRELLVGRWRWGAVHLGQMLPAVAELLSQAESWAAREWGEQPRRGYPAFTDR